MGILSQRGEERLGHPSLFPSNSSLFSLRYRELLLDELVKGSATCLFLIFKVRSNAETPLKIKHYQLTSKIPHSPDDSRL